ncbi:MAG: FAD-dependent oxidoreductase [Candidatus Methylomirabilia bacterium]
MKRYESWGRHPKLGHALAVPMFWRSEPLRFDEWTRPVLPYAQGRSYGDCCLNEGGILIDTSGLSRFIAFDEGQGILRCEAGVTLAEILELVVPRGWFLPVTPGTKYVSVGGAIANDVHGKNHHRAGTFGRYVRRFELARSAGERFVCSPSENADLFRATVGGLGLTGLILWAELQLRPISSPLIAMERIRFGAVEEFFELSALSDKEYEYTVAWVDPLAQGAKLGRGIFLRGNHVQGAPQRRDEGVSRRTRGLPFDAPAFLLSPLTMRAFNTAYYYAQWRKQAQKMLHYDPFFYPLDTVQDWNRLYGKRGFLQYQCVVPCDDDYRTIKEILSRIGHSGLASFLGVLKVFGTISSPGMLSFPRPGVTVSLDFPYQGGGTLGLLRELDGIVCASRGAVYPAKDACMSAKSFRTYFPQWREFARFIDPKFSSSFWRRVAIGVDGGEDEGSGHDRDDLGG